MDWKALAKDKRVWAGAAVVAAVAVVAVVRNRAAGGGGGAGGEAGAGGTPAAPQGYYQGTGDTTGTDLSGFLSNWSNAQLGAQQAGYQSILDALKGGGESQNADAPPAVVYAKDPTGKSFWALLNSPYGGWMQTDSQTTANQWAAKYSGSSQTADSVTWDAFGKLKDKWSK